MYNCILFSSLCVLSAYAGFEQDYFYPDPSLGEDALNLLLEEGLTAKTRDTQIRDYEELPHSSLWGHKYIGGGAGEGQQFLKPEGSLMNKQEVKTDSVLPAYCEPPNPCPIGFSSEDGCLEEFENSAEFSRSYQGKQDCMCDEEHMFNCPTAASHDGDLAAAEELSQMEQLIKGAHIDGMHPNLIAKKFHAKKKKST